MSVLALGLAACGSGLLWALDEMRSANARATAAVDRADALDDTVRTNQQRIVQLESYIKAHGETVPPPPPTTTTTTARRRASSPRAGTSATVVSPATTNPPAAPTTTQRPAPPTTQPPSTTSTTTRPCTVTIPGVCV